MCIDGSALTWLSDAGSRVAVGLDETVVAGEVTEA